MSFLALNQLTTQGFTDWKEPLMSRAARIFACALALTLSLASIDARADEPESQDPVVFSKGLRARIADGKLRSAKLAFTESAVTVRLNPGISERFEFGQLRVRRGQHRMNLPLIDGWYWLSLSPSIAISIATGGLSDGAQFLLGSLVGSHASYFLKRMTNRHEQRWLSLHSDAEHRCAFLVLPRKEPLRLEILEEFANRSKKELRVRSPDDPALRDWRPYPAEGEPAPDFALPGLDGTHWRLSELRGKAVLVNFWATWCGPCRKELPHLEKLHQRFSREGLVVLGVSDEKAAESRAFLEEHGITFPTLNDHAAEVFRRYRVTAIPTTLIIGPDGRLRERIEGYTKANAFVKAVKPYLAKPR